MKTITLSILALIIFACCGHTRKTKMDDTPNTEQDSTYDGLNGKWELFKTVCCGRMSKEILVGENDRKEYLKFYSDKKIVKTFDMGFLLDNSPYEFTNLIDQPDSPQQFIKIGDKNPAMYVIEDDILILSWEYMDLERKYYKKVK
jgi:hypothetical protein